MKYLILLLLFFTLSCSLNKVKNNHGVISLKDKFNKINVNQSNKNDIINILGPPSTKSSFDNNVWIYIERKKTNQSIYKLGIKKISKNNVLIVKFNNRGLVSEKNLLNFDNMNDLTTSDKKTIKKYKQDNFVYNILSSLRDKINAPTRRAK